MKKIIIINGINLKELGTREVNIYGNLRFDDFFAELKQNHPTIDLIYHQSDNVEEIAQYILQHKEADGIILNPGAFTHTSLILADTIKNVMVPVIEVHISNLYGRELYRRKSLISSVCKGQICGFGLKGYEMALSYFES